MVDNLRRVELGCGSTKTEGYIGIDRYPLPKVDLVADLNHGIPIEDNSVDIIYACHSLEHLDNLENIVSEIYRVSKHKSIVMILAPYSATSLNAANPYHNLIFNEETFRFFSCYPTARIREEEYECPHAKNWGLELSDNSEKTVELEIVSMEFFYYQEYRCMSEMEQLHARKAFKNVCDQIYYVLAVNKSEVPFTTEEFKQLHLQARELEPALINLLRERDKNWQVEESVLTDITSKVLKRQEEELIESLGKYSQQVNQLNNMINGHDDYIKKLDFDFTKFQADMKDQINTLKEELKQAYILNDQMNLSLNLALKTAAEKHDSLTALGLELLQSRERRFLPVRKLSIYRKNMDLYSIIRQGDFNFTDGLTLLNPTFQAKSIITLSNSIPFNNYFEYQLTGYGNKIHFFVIANIGAKLFVEIVQNGKITKQEHMVLNQEGHQNIQVDSISGAVSIRFKTTDNKSIVRVLEIGNKILAVLAKKSLASFID